MKHFLILFVVIAWGCSPAPTEIPKSEKANKTVTVLADSVTVIAETIIYPVTIKNPIAEDEWTGAALSGLNKTLFLETILAAIDNGKLMPYDYFTEEALSAKQIKKLIKENGGIDAIGNIQFTEDWFLDPNSMLLTKQVKAMVFGFELFDENGLVKSYKAAFKVDINNDLMI